MIHLHFIPVCYRRVYGINMQYNKILKNNQKLDIKFYLERFKLKIKYYIIYIYIGINKYTEYPLYIYIYI